MACFQGTLEEQKRQLSHMKFTSAIIAPRLTIWYNRSHLSVAILPTGRRDLLWGRSFECTPWNVYNSKSIVKLARFSKFPKSLTIRKGEGNGLMGTSQIKSGDEFQNIRWDRSYTSNVWIPVSTYCIYFRDCTGVASSSIHEMPSEEGTFTSYYTYIPGEHIAYIQSGIYSMCTFTTVMSFQSYAKCLRKRTLRTSIKFTSAWPQQLHPHTIQRLINRVLQKV